MHGDILLVAVLNTCTLVWLLRSWFLIDRITWKFHIIIWRKFRYFWDGVISKDILCFWEFRILYPVLVCKICAWNSLQERPAILCKTDSQPLGFQKIPNDRQVYLLTWASFKAWETLEIVLAHWYCSGSDVLSECSQLAELDHESVLDTCSLNWLSHPKATLCVSSKSNIILPKAECFLL